MKTASFFILFVLRSLRCRFMEVRQVVYKNFSGKKGDMILLLMSSSFSTFLLLIIFALELPKPSARVRGFTEGLWDA